MTDIQRDFLYQFNGCLNSIYTNKPSIVSVFENIDNGTLKLCPDESANASFLEKVKKCIHVIKMIVTNPYVVTSQRQEIVPVSQAKKVNVESIKLTLLDSSLWATKDGKLLPKKAYSQENEEVYISYENAFVYQLICLLIKHLKSLKIKLFDAISDSSAEVKEQYDSVCKFITQLSKLSKEKVFADNMYRVIDLSNVYVTDILMSDSRYNYCYSFFNNEIKWMSVKVGVAKDFRVLYHNFALIQIMYNLYKNGFSVEDTDYYVASTGKIFIKPLTFNGGKKIDLSQSKNGIDLLCNGNLTRIEFAKSLILNVDDIVNDAVNRYSKISNVGKYKDVYIAYLTSSEFDNGRVVNIGYKNVAETVVKLINNL